MAKAPESQELNEEEQEMRSTMAPKSVKPDGAGQIIEK